MKWTHEPGGALPVLELNQTEAKMLTEILAQHARRNVRMMYDKSKDIHVSGEATYRQSDLMFK